MARIMENLTCIESEKGAREGSNLTLTWRRFSTTVAAGKNAVDGDGFLRRRCTRDEEDDPETTAMAARGAGAKRFEEIFNSRPSGYKYPFAVGVTEL